MNLVDTMTTIWAGKLTTRVRDLGKIREKGSFRGGWQVIRELVTSELIGPLNEIEQKNSPARLFVKGDIGLLRNTARVSIVGSRKATPEGVKRAKRLARILTEKRVVVVSGLAEGIDTAAHESAIDCGGRTVGVLGTGIDKSYPSKNKALQAAIGEGHLLVSQFPVGHVTRPWNFPERNRTMALISHCTVIVEAQDKSGSIHQGWEAIRLGRPLYIAKSQVSNDSLLWPKELLRYGACILDEDSIEDLIYSLPLSFSENESLETLSI